MTVKYKTVRPDAKGRITLGRIAENVSSYKVTQDKHNRIILEPMVEIPLQEQWLFQNKKALQQVQKGLEDAALSKTKKKGSFAKYVEDEIE